MGKKTLRNREKKIQRTKPLNTANKSLERDDFLFIIGVIALSALCFGPIFTSGYFNDDIYNASMRGILVADNQSMLEWILSTSLRWLKSGRLFIAFWLFPMYLIPSMLGFKIAIFFFTAVASICFYYMCLQLSCNKTVTRLLTLLIPMLCFMPQSYTAIIFTPALVQTTFILFCSSIFFLVQYLKNKRWLTLCISVFCWFLSLLLYEVIYPMLPCILLIIFLYQKENRYRLTLKNGAPYIVSWLIAIFTYLAVYLHAENIYDGNKVSLDMLLIIKTYFLHLFNVTPLPNILNYFIFQGNPFSVKSIIADIKITEILAILLFIYLSLSYVFSQKQSQPTQYEDGKCKLNPQALSVYILSLFLFLMPSGLMAVTEKYQTYINMAPFGLPYLATYIQQFGFYILVSLFIVKGSYFIAKKYKKVYYTCIIFVVSILYLTGSFVGRNGFLNNENNYARDPSLLLQDAVKHGIAKDLPSNVILLTDDIKSYAYMVTESSYFATLLPKIHWKLMKSEEYLLQKVLPSQSYAEIDTTKDSVYTIKVVCQNNGYKYISLGKVTKASFTNGNLSYMECQNIKFYDYTNNSQDGLGAYSLSENYYSPAYYRFQQVNKDLRIASINSPSLWSSLTVTAEKDFNYSAPKIAGFSSTAEHPQVFKNTTDTLFHILSLSEGNLIALDLLTKEQIKANEFGAFTFSSPSNMDNSFSVQILLKPDTQVNTYADIISNHVDNKGFCVEQVGDISNLVNFSQASDSGWVSSEPFLLAENQYNYIAISVDETHRIYIYLNGQLIQQYQGKTPLASSDALVIGNWAGMNRQFLGSISEASIQNGPMPANLAEETWVEIMKQYGTESSK